MQIFPFDIDHADRALTLDKAVFHLARGQLVAMPTETVYGLAGDATNGEAVARIFETKMRPQFNPLIAHVSGLEMAKTIGMFDDVSAALAAEFWPGPLTLVVTRNPAGGIHELVSAGLETIAIRCPRGAARELIAAFGAALAAPSANRSGRISPTSAKHITTEFGDKDILVLDGGDCSVGIESTIASVEKGQIKLLRAGAISMEQLAQSTGLNVNLVNAGSKIVAPGQLSSHYAPRAKVRLACKAKQQPGAMLAFGPGHEGELNLSVKADLREAAANLYRHLRALDERGVETICVTAIPETGLGIAINDRLRRAAAPRSLDGEQS